MLRFKVDKLVRDRTPERMAQKGWTGYYSEVEEDEVLPALLKKLQEETQEVIDADELEDQLHELADVLEVIHALADALEISMADIERTRKALARERGAFERKVFCDYIEIDENNPAKEYCLQRPEKYPRIK